MAFFLSGCSKGGGVGGGGGGGLSGPAGGGGASPTAIVNPLSISPNAKVLGQGETVQFSASGGYPPYIYNLVSGPGSLNTSTGFFTAPLGQGTAVVRLIDSTGVSVDAHVIVEPPFFISPSAPQVGPSYAIAFSATQGTAPYTFSIVSGGGSIVSSTGAFTAPASPGTVDVRVTDSTGLITDAFVTVNPALQIAPAAKTVGINGSATFTATGTGAPPYTYSMASGGGSINATTGVYTAPAATGSASVKVTDSYGLTSMASITIMAPPVISPASVTLAVNDGFTFSASGGSAPYSYSVVSGGGSIVAATGAYTAPAAAGTATVRVTDNNGLTSDATVTINPALAISPAATVLAVGYSTSFSATGGVGSYTYSIFSGGGSIVAATGAYTAPATTGSATVRVTDSLGNTSDAAVTIGAALAIVPSSKTLVVNQVFTFSATGGVGPYSYSVFSGGGSVGSSTGAYTAPATAGSATVRVTDSFGYTSDSAVTINAHVAISPASKTLAVNDVFTFTAVGGLTPYSYSIVSGGGSIVSTSGAYTAPAASGTATVRVTDASGGTSDATVTINPALAISPTTASVEQGLTATFSASGGVSPYTFSVFSGGGSVNSSTGVYAAPAAAGSATVRVTDAVGNTADATVTIPAALAISPSTKTLLGNQSFTFTASGGIAPYTYSVFSGGGSVGSASGTYTAPATAGSATVRVTDAGGVTSDATITINPPVQISPSTKTLAVNDVFTFGETGGLGPYTFSIVSGGGSINSSTGAYTAPATTGTATVRVTDSTNATSDATVTINPALAISPTSYTIAVNKTTTFSASGGVGTYTYSVFSGGGSVVSNSGAYTAPATSGSATVRVTDSFGNTADAAVTINPALAISPSSKTLAIGNSYTFSATGTGRPGYTFSIASGGGSVNSSTGAYTAPGVTGSATVRVTDADGSTSDAAITIVPLPSITPSSKTLMVGNSTTFGGTNGVPSYSYSIVSGGGTINASTGLYTAPATSGTATVRLTDSMGNTSDATVTINPQIAISPSPKTAIILENYTFTVTGGVGPYTYSVFSGSGSINSSSGVYTAPGATGTDDVRVTDSLGNTSDSTVTIIKPTKVIAGVSHSCALFSNGSVKCWGGNASGQLGYGDTTTRGSGASQMGDNLPFVSLGTGRTATDITTRGNHTCALLDNATVKCWGDNTYGQLGQGNTTNYGSAANQMGDNLPAINLGTGRTATAIAAGGNHTCALLDNSTIKCWGYNAFGQLGQGNTTNIGSGANQMGDNLAAITFGAGLTPNAVKSGANHSCALFSDTSMRCWGYNADGQLGQEDTVNYGSAANQMSSLAAINVQPSSWATSMSLGDNHTCVVTNGAAAKCWGLGASGQLGLGSTSNVGDAKNTMGSHEATISLGTGRTATAVASGLNHSCALLDNATVKCWGLDSSGQDGQGTTTNYGSAANQMGDSLAAISLGTGRTALSVAAGGNHTCALLDNYTVKCWGANSSGELGQGNTTTVGSAAGQMGDSLAAIVL